MKKAGIVLFITIMSMSVSAQTIQEGTAHLYAERTASARGTFEKMLAANPNNIEATYWLGQTHLVSNNIAAARSLYEKALASNGNAPLILVGMGHVELAEGKTNEARQRFETAISLSRGKKGDDPNVLNAIGRANVDAKAGDVAYAIAKLTSAAQSAPNNAEIFLNLGNAYRKAHEGGQAATNYAKAKSLNPSFAIASYRTAKLYQTQNNWEIVVEHLNNAISADARFAPAYEDLAYYYLLYKKDFGTAESYANKFTSNADPSVENDYMKASIAYVQKKYDQAISMANNIVSAGGANAKPRVFRLLGYSYLDKGDTAKACEYVNQFFAKAKEEDMVGKDYLLHATSCGKGNPAIIRADVQKAVDMDSVLSRQLSMISEAVAEAKANNQKLLEGELRMISFKLRGDKANPAELFQIGLPFYQGGAFQRADSVFQAYATALPDSIYGHYWSYLSNAQIDTTMELGLAVPYAQKALEVAERDKVRFKNQGVQVAGYLAGYYNNVKKDKAMAIQYLKKGLEFDPANVSLQNSLRILESAPAPKQTKPATKTSTSANSAKSDEIKVKTEKGKTKVKKG